MPNNDRCVFCDWFNDKEKFKKDEAHRLIEFNDEYVVILDRSPKVAAHMLVIWRKHYDDICATPTKEIQAIVPVISRYCKKIKEVMLAKKVYVYTMCEHWEEWELKGRETTEHLHFHLLPRYDGAPRGEDLFTLRAKKAGIDWEATPTTLQEIANKLRN